MTKTWIAIAVLLAFSYVMVERSFVAGYEQGYAEGQDRALMSPQSFETCTKWWFDGDAKRARQVMKDFCKKSKI